MRKIHGIVGCLLVIAAISGCAQRARHTNADLQRLHEQSRELRMLNDGDKALLVKQAHEWVCLRIMKREPEPCHRDAQVWMSQPHRVYVTLRKDGLIQGCQSALSRDLCDAVRQAVDETVSDGRFEAELSEQDLPLLSVELNIVSPEVELRDLDWATLRATIKPGVHGIRLTVGDRGAYFKNTVPVTHGYSLETALERLGKKAGESTKAWRYREARIAVTDEVHLVQSDAPGGFVELRRCLLPAPEKVDRAAIEQAMRAGCDWLQRNQLAGGLYAYQFKPGALSWSEDDNRVRQAGTAYLMANAGRFFGADAYTQSARRCLDSLLELVCYAEEGNRRPYVPHDGPADLGSTGLTLLAMLHLEDPGVYEQWLCAFGDTIVSAQQPDGSFACSFTDADFTGGQDYYPGEAMYALSVLYERTRETKYLQCLQRAFPFYRAYWRGNPNTAFYAWQTHAAYHLYGITGERMYAEFALEMADWIADRAWTPSRVDDAQYRGGINQDPPGFSTGTYMEGLTEAYALARAVGEDGRARRYRDVCLAGVGFMLQLQCKEAEAFYIPRELRGCFVGGFRGSLTYHGLRCDYTQHIVQALMNVLQLVESDPCISR